MKRAALAVFLLVSALAFGQGTCHKDTVNGSAPSGYLKPVAGAQIRVCSDTLSPCTTVPIYSDAALTQPLSNPIASDTNGNYSWCAAPGNYNEQMSGVFNTVNNTPVSIAGEFSNIKIAARCDNATDDTSVIQAAINQATAYQRTFTLPAGRCKVTSTLQVNTKGIEIHGTHGYRPETTGGTSIEFSGTGPLFQLGSDNGHAYDANEYDGVQDFMLADVILRCPNPTTPLANGIANYCGGTYAIRDWRGGDIQLRNVSIEHFEYGFWGIQSDFNEFSGSGYVMYNHVGVYLGPRSDQANIKNQQYMFNDTALYLDGAVGTRVESHFVFNGSPTTAPIQIHSTFAYNTRNVTFAPGTWYENGGTGQIGMNNFVDIGVGDSIQSVGVYFEQPNIVNSDVGNPRNVPYFAKVGNATKVKVTNVVDNYSTSFTSIFQVVGANSPILIFDDFGSNTPTTVTTNSGGGSPLTLGRGTDGTYQLFAGPSKFIGQLTLPSAFFYNPVDATMNVPVRCGLTVDENCRFTFQDHNGVVKYVVGFNADGTFSIDDSTTQRVILTATETRFRLPAAGFQTFRDHNNAEFYRVDEATGETRPTKLAINGDTTMTSAPRMAYADRVEIGANNATQASVGWTPDKPITITRFQVFWSVAAAGCSTQPILSISDSTPTNYVSTGATTFNNGATTPYDSGSVSVNVAAGKHIFPKWSTASVGCTTQPAGIHYSVQYKMQ